MSGRPKRAAAAVPSRDIANMFNQIAERGRRPPPIKASAKQVPAPTEEGSEDSEELISTPFTERPPSPTKFRPRLQSPLSSLPSDAVDNTKILDESSDASAAGSTPMEQAQDDALLADLSSKYAKYVSE